MRTLAALAILLLAGCNAPLGTDAPDGGEDPAAVPDPLGLGPRTPTRLEYDFGYFVVDDPSLVVYHYTVPLHGSLHLPDGDGPFPVLAFMHGRHSTCDYAGQLEFLAVACTDAPPVVEPVDSYTGYDGLAENLASWGYAVLSIDANTINDRDLAGDSGANARGALVLRTLDEFASVNATGHGLGNVDGGQLPQAIPTNAPERDASAAQGKLDLSRVGLMGHSRGGEGVARAVSLDAGSHGLDAVFALAPTDFARWPVAGVAFATLLPYCDGDVSNLQGAWMYDDARRLEPAAPRHQVLAMGADHNFYNTVWTGDDWGTTGEWCGSEAKDNGRDSPEQQRAHGYGLMASFFRLYVGGEQAFAPLWDGAGSVFPSSMCPGRASCDDRLYASAMHVRHHDLAADGKPGVQQGLQPAACAGADCPATPTYTLAAQTVWDCSSHGTATFAAPADREAWDALSMRVGGTNATIRLWVEAGDQATPDAALPTRPGGDNAKTILSEVRFALHDLGAGDLVVHCSGDGKLQVADVMLV